MIREGRELLANLYRLNAALLARDEAKNTLVESNGGPSQTGKAAVRAITGSPQS